VTPIRSEYRATVLALVLITFAAEAARMADRREVLDHAPAELASRNLFRLASNGREDWMPLPAADIFPGRGYRDPDDQAGRLSRIDQGSHWQLRQQLR